ncbi:MAG TPA: class I SAM-dependent methyltransferase [Pseudolabrys sp.]|jgi:2-polyprenyl-3-methyl-5-hydroxy-6-metoxy-1,4-benzoquinol methylase
MEQIDEGLIASFPPSESSATRMVQSNASNLRIDDIRPDAVMTNHAAAVMKDVEWLKARSHLFQPVPCPACGTDRPQRLYVKHGTQHNRCPECATQYVSPRAPEALLIDFYAESENAKYWAAHIYPTAQDTRRKRLFGPRAKIAADLAAKYGFQGGVLVEVGAGYGMFCKEAEATGAFRRIIGIEPEKGLAETCASPGVEVIAEGYEFAQFDEKPNMIVCFEVIEHLHDPHKFMQWCADKLAPGGVVMLTTPNGAGFETTTLAERSHTIDHQHINLLNPKSIAQLARRVGFAEVEVTTPGQFDVELVRRAFAEGRVTADVLGPFLTFLARDADEATCNAFQQFLRDTGLSSHMRMIARMGQ